MIQFARAGLRAAGKRHGALDAGKLLRMARRPSSRIGVLAPNRRQNKRRLPERLITAGSEVHALLAQSKNRITSRSMTEEKPRGIFKRFSVMGRKNLSEANFTKEFPRIKLAGVFKKPALAAPFDKIEIHQDAVRPHAQTVTPSLGRRAAGPSIRVAESGLGKESTVHLRSARKKTSSRVISSLAKNSADWKRMPSSFSSRGPLRLARSFARLYSSADKTGFHLSAEKPLSKSVAPVLPMHSRMGREPVAAPVIRQHELRQSSLEKAHGKAATLVQEMMSNKKQFGRWFNEFASADARRPPSGVGGFDSRAAPIWPGRKPAF